MKITLGENVKRFRRERNITQEEMAEMFGVSCAAVSKWERGETYPDMELLLPLADYFGVSTDELLGYNESRRAAELERIFKAHNKLMFEFRRDEEIKLLSEARREFPRNYEIMHRYMWAVIGGRADNDPEVLRANADEFLPMCDQILANSTDGNLRRGAISMKAKILHAQGKTDEAVAIYRDNFTDWYSTVGQVTEQLFAKDTPQFHHQLVANMLELIDFAANKKLKEIWYCCGYSIDEKAKAGMELGLALSLVREKFGYDRLSYVEGGVYGDHVWKLMCFGGRIEDIAECLDKQLGAAVCCDMIGEKDKMFREFCLENFRRNPKFGNNTSVLSCRLHYYTTTDVEPHRGILRTSECAEVLEKYRRIVSSAEE